jgi:hypothetical protein
LDRIFEFLREESKVKLLVYLVCFMQWGIAMANDLDVAVAFDGKTQVITITLTNVGDENILIADSLGFLKEKAKECNPFLPAFRTMERILFSTIKSTGEPFSGIDVKVNSSDMTSLSTSDIFPDGYIQNRIFISSFIEPSWVSIQKNLTYVKKLHLQDIIRGLPVNFDRNNMKGLFVKIRAQIYLENPAIKEEIYVENPSTGKTHKITAVKTLQTIVKETDWILIE